MIKYNLKCNNNHNFDSWFSTSQDYEKLKKKKLLSCPECNSPKIQKSIMSPMLSGMKENNNQIKILNENFQNEKNKLLKLRKFIENNFEYVGENFSKKVREVYYDKSNKKTIYGTATLEEKKELEEEGIDLLSIPWVNKDN